MFIGGFVTELPTQGPRMIDHARNELAPGPARHETQQLGLTFRPEWGILSIGKGAADRRFAPLQVTRSNR